MTWGGRLSKKAGTRLNSSNVVFLQWIVLYFVNIWSVRKETSWKQGNLFKTATKNKEQNKLVSIAISDELVSDVNKSIGYSNVAYVFSVGPFPHFSKIFRANFPSHWTHHLHPLDVTVMRPLETKYTDGQSWKKISILDLWSNKWGYNRLCTTSLIYD